MLPLKGGRRRTTEHADEAFLHLLDTFWSIFPQKYDQRGQGYIPLKSYCIAAANMDRPDASDLSLPFLSQVWKQIGK